MSSKHSFARRRTQDEVKAPIAVHFAEATRKINALGRGCALARVAQLTAPYRMSHCSPRSLVIGTEEIRNLAEPNRHDLEFPAHSYRNNNTGTMQDLR